MDAPRPARDPAIAGTAAATRPHLVRLEPSAAAPGSMITAYGEGLDPMQSLLGFPVLVPPVAVFEGTQRYESKTITRSPTALSFVVPPGSGSAMVRIGTGAGDSESLPFTYQVPEISSVTPASGWIGDMIMIRGRGFGDRTAASGSRVVLGGTVLLPLQWNDSLIVVKAPGDLGTGLAEELVMGALGCIYDGLTPWRGVTEKVLGWIFDPRLPGCEHIFEEVIGFYHLVQTADVVEAQRDVTVTTTAGSSNPGTFTFRLFVAPDLSVVVSPASASLYLGEQRQLNATISGNVPSAILWRSSDVEVAQVSPTGTVTARTPGTATIAAIATADPSVQGAANVTVLNRPSDASISMSPGSLELDPGQSAQVVATVTGADDPSVRWSTMDPVVATVSSSGRVTGIGRGSTRIVAALVTDPAKQASIPVTVAPSQAPITITVSPASLALRMGEFAQLVAAVTGSSNTGVIWSSSDPSRVTVSSSGRVQGIWPGAAVVSAAPAAEPTRRFSVLVTVAAQDLPTSVTVSPSALALRTGETRQLAATVTGSGNTAITWFSADPSIATISSTGLVKAISPGTVEVTAASVANPSARSSTRVTVTAPPSPVLVTIDPATVTLRAGETHQMIATVTGSSNAGVYWYTDHPELAVVNDAGLVKGIGMGTATITAQSLADRARSASARITVTASPVLAAPTVATLPASGVTATGFQLNGRVNPNGVATSAYFEWSFGDPSLAAPRVSNAVPVGEGAAALGFTDHLVNGSCGSAYYYRMVAVNSLGMIARGIVQEVRTAACAR